MIDLQELIRDTLNLEPLSESSAKLVGLVAAEEPDLDGIIDVVRYDEALAARTLGAANAATSGSVTEILTVEAAVVRLGPSWVLSLAMAAAVQTRIGMALPQYGMAEGELWRHSVCASIAAEELRELTEVPVEAPSTALLHDIGKLVLARHLRRHLLLEIRRLCADGISGLHAESEVLGINHAELGSMIARHWGLPESIAQGIAFHHHPSEAPDDVDPRLVHAVHLADAVAGLSAGGVDRDYLSLEEAGLSLRVLGLRRSALRTLCQATEERADEVLGANASG